MDPKKDASVAWARFDRLRRSARLTDQGGFALVELLVALLIFTIALGMATELYISNLRSTNTLRQRVQLLDNTDFVKSYLTSYLATADSPPAGGGDQPTWNDWRTLTITSSGRCYRISLDTATHPGELDGQDAATCDADWELIDKTPLAQNVINTSLSPLFVFKDKKGRDVLDPAFSESLDDAKEVAVQLILDNPNDSVGPQKRVLTYTLGGVYLANQFGPDSIGSSQIVDGSVTNQKIGVGAISGANFDDGSIGVGKLTSAARASSISFPLLSGAGDSWSVSSTSSWDQGPNDAFTRAGATLGDYCVQGKALQARGSFVVRNGTSDGLRLQFKLVRDDGQGGSQADYAISDAPTSDNVPGSGYGSVTTPWQTISCSSPENTAYFYAPRARAGNSGSTGKQFSLVEAALELRYQ